MYKKYCIMFLKYLLALCTLFDGVVDIFGVDAFDKMSAVLSEIISITC